MGYLHIPNLYRPEAQRILEFKRLYALEKIHGTSAHLGWRKGTLKVFPGGEGIERFQAIFDLLAIQELFRAKFGDVSEATIFGEAYGGKQQGMSATYGPNLRFVAFDVEIDGRWLMVEQAAGFTKEFGLEFVDYALIPATIEAIDAERDKPSAQAIRNGVVESKIREGVVLRPPFEVTLNNGERLIAKHKRVEFSERSSGYPGLLDPVKKAAMESGEKVAAEWVTAERLEHVIDHIKARRGDGRELSIEDTSAVVAEMVEDVRRESASEVIWDKGLQKPIGHKTVKLFKARLEASIPRS